jgi:hypothetical protein
VQLTPYEGIWLEGAEQYVQKDLVRAIYHVQGQRGGLHVSSRSDSVIVVDSGSAAAADQKGGLTRVYEVKVQVLPL